MQTFVLPERLAAHTEGARCAIYPPPESPVEPNLTARSVQRLDPDGRLRGLALSSPEVVVVGSMQGEVVRLGHRVRSVNQLH